MQVIKKFLTKPRNMFFSIIIMATLVCGLAKVSFSFVDDSNYQVGNIDVERLDIRLHGDEIPKGFIEIPAETYKTIDVYVMSNNTYPAQYKLYYEKVDGITVKGQNTEGQIDAKDVLKVSLEINNPETVAKKINIGLLSANLEQNIELPEDKVAIK